MIKQLFFMALISCISFIHNAEAMQGHESLAGGSEVSPRRIPLYRQQSINDVEQVKDAVIKNDFELLQRLLEEGKKAYTDATVHGKKVTPALRVAVLKQNKKMIALLLDYDKDVDWQDDNGNTHLHGLVNNGDDPYGIEIFRLFLEKTSANLNIKNDQGNTVINIIKNLGEQARELRKILIAERPEHASAFAVSKQPNLQNVPKLNFKGSQLSPRLQSIEKRKAQSTLESNEESTGIMGSIGYFTLGAAGTIAALRLYTLFFKSKEQQKKPIQ